MKKLLVMPIDFVDGSNFISKHQIMPLKTDIRNGKILSEVSFLSRSFLFETKSSQFKIKFLTFLCIIELILKWNQNVIDLGQKLYLKNIWQEIFFFSLGASFANILQVGLILRLNDFWTIFYIQPFQSYEKIWPCNLKHEKKSEEVLI